MRKPEVSRLVQQRSNKVLSLLVLRVDCGTARSRPATLAAAHCLSRERHALERNDQTGPNIELGDAGAADTHAARTDPDESAGKRERHLPGNHDADFFI